eukprot:443139-Pelagomonas_calceolata.AAC.2
MMCCGVRSWADQRSDPLTHSPIGSKEQEEAGACQHSSECSPCCVGTHHEAAHDTQPQTSDHATRNNETPVQGSW